ncbi:YcaO-like family protein [Kibdelosporangium persicum]|uniref:YcaO domain-containing protein n=1 Tax=Kibdelosporangium persicum TaxID=2698649 RepID=A0ABX2F6U4_9PSEU|nr:YcaO-like family protein [Kibdelosporangium persicum]NRN66538.1 YcaO domain-containing protein [Kibdelosporangium persicum]
MRPLLRPDVYLAESEDGAYLLTHRGPVRLTGHSVHRFIERLTPYLDGSHTLDELTAGLAAERAEAVRKLVGMLRDRDVVRDMSPAASVVDASSARPEITYLGYFDDDPGRAFERYQGMRALVLGEGPVASAVVHAAARSGLSHVVRSSTMGGALVDGVDLVLHVATEFSDAERLEQWHHGWRAQVVLRGAHAWLGVAGPGQTELWGSARRRLAAWHRAEPDGRGLGTAAITAVAARLVHGTFRAVTGLDEPRSDRLTGIDLSTLEDQTHAVVPHPLARPVVPTTPDITVADVDPEMFSRQAAVCTDDVIGLLGEPSERDLAQIPLRVCEITVSDPVGLLGADALAPVVTGVGLDFATARYRAALRAFACYGSLMVDRRRVRDGCVTGYALESMDPVLVPVSLAFPVLDGAAVPYEPPIGVAAGYSWLEAVEAGLAGYCRQLTMTEQQPPRLIDLAAVPLDGPGNRYRAMLAAIGHPVTVYDITGSLGVPTLLCHLDDRPVACASRLDALAALTDTLEQAVLHYQATENGQTGYAPPPAPVLPTRDGPVAPLPASVDLTTAVRALIGLGHRPVAVPLDHDQEAHEILPHTFRVVLLDD